MELFRLAAYAVDPERNVEQRTEPEGGMLEINEALRRAMDEVPGRVRADEWTDVDFEVDEETRTCHARDLILQFLFHHDDDAMAASRGLALRLAAAMDRRSHPFLLLEAGYAEGDRRKAGLWAFPRDEAFRFRGGRIPAIELLADVFSRTSRLRKGAEFAGRNLRTDLLSGRVLDLQAGPNVTNVANYWVERFLECTLGLTPEIGTTVMAQALRDAYDAADPDQQAQLHTAAIAVRHGPARDLSLQDFGEQYLTEELRELVLRSSSEPQLSHARFRFRPETFDRYVTTHVYRLDNGVIVSAPLNEVGDSVVIDEQRQLTATGRIASERIKGG